MNSERECSVCGTDVRVTAICSIECEEFARTVEDVECPLCGETARACDMTESIEGLICETCVDYQLEEERAADVAWEEGMHE